MDKVLKYAHRLLEEVVTSNDICLDMTLGCGKDTLFLKDICKKVYAFDIQEEAIKKSKELMKDCKNVEFILDGHENVLLHINEKVKGIIFNLGYLPGGNKKITTHFETTIKALKDSLTLLSDKGICVICLYPGHLEGNKESIEVTKYVKGLNQKEFTVLKYEFINQINNPPFLIAIEKNENVSSSKL